MLLLSGFWCHFGDLKNLPPRYYIGAAGKLSTVLNFYF